MKRTTLEEAVAEHVEPGMHLNFASTPSRSNAAIRAVARRFRGSDPAFTLSTTGFHSTAHLLGMLRLGRRYIACFFGDNYPTPRPNALYQELLAEGADLQHWSLWTYVSALRAAAFGQPYAFTRSLTGTTLGQRLAESGCYFEVAAPSEDGTTAGEPLGLLKPIVPDITFLHSALGDERGYAWFSPPHSEGFHGAFAARRGVVITVDAFAEPSRIESHPELIPIPPHRVLAICEAPFGAHPQPVHLAPHDLAALGYDDDYEHYRLWREMTTNVEPRRRFLDDVLAGGEQAYRAFVGPSRLRSLCAPRSRSCAPDPSAQRHSAGRTPCAVPVASLDAMEPGERQILLAGRAIAARIREAGYSSILAGIGLSFSAARLAQRQLADDGVEVELLVETGLAGFAATPDRRTDSYLLSRTNMLDSRRLTGVENILGSSVRGSTNACLGVIGSAQVDRVGDINSTLVEGKHLVGSGGACDVALGAQEVIVLARSERLVARVSYVTSPGRKVQTVVTERSLLKRSHDGGWWLREYVSEGDYGLPAEWDVEAQQAARADDASALEWSFLESLREEASSQKHTSGAEAR
jgi:acyl CoA:acetate/3-ketoacid CoA transferase beta subunit/acyl CoA:acetate/3-ketoacid CoA transferase alpha subunit